MLTAETFKCDRKCADCCKYLTVKLSNKDIMVIKEGGYGEEDFLEYDGHIDSAVLKVNDAGCVFLTKKGDKYYCKIYKIRPCVCKQYPFVSSNKIESCKPNLLRYKFKKQLNVSCRF